MPPPRRRPVRPATRVRLPRSARSQPATPASEASPAAGRDSQETAGRIGAGGEPEAGRASATAEDTRPAGTLTESTPAESTLTEDTLTEAARGGPEAAGREPEASEAATGFDEGTALDEGTGSGGKTEAEAAVGLARAGRPAGRGERRHPLLLPACLGAVAVILGGLAAWFGLAGGNAGNGVNTQNLALINPAATRQVNQAIDAAVTTIFSYNYADVAKTQQAAQRLLTGQAIRQYNTLFRLVAQNAPKEKLVLTTSVTSSGVELLAGSMARLLIFINQSDTSNAVHKTTVAGAMFSVTAVRQGGQWKISAINTFARL